MTVKCLKWYVLSCVFSQLLKGYILSFIWTSQRSVFVFVFVFRVPANTLWGYLLLFVSRLKVYDSCLIWRSHSSREQSQILLLPSTAFTPCVVGLCCHVRAVWDSLTGSLLDLIISHLCLGMKTRLLWDYMRGQLLCRACKPRELIRFGISDKCLFAEKLQLTTTLTSLHVDIYLKSCDSTIICESLYFVQKTLRSSLIL